MDADLRRKERDRTLSVADLARTGDLLAMAELAEGAEQHALCVEWLIMNDGAVNSPENVRSYFQFGTGLWECEPRGRGGMCAPSAVYLRKVNDEIRAVRRSGLSAEEKERGLPDLRELFRGTLLEVCKWLRENRVNKVGSPCQ